MGNFPLVALQGKPPDIRDFGQQQLLDAETKRIQGQNALQPGQLQGQQNDLQEQRLRIQQMQTILQGNQAVVSAQHDPEWNAGDPDQVVRIFKKYNVPLPLQGQAMKVITDMQTGMMGASKESLAMSQQAHSYMDDQIESIKSAPPDGQQKAYQQALSNVRAYVSRFPDGPGKADAFQEIASAPPLYDQQWIDNKHAQLKTQSSLIEESLKRAQAAEAEGKGAQAQAESNLLLAKTPGAQAESTMQQQEAAM